MQAHRAVLHCVWILPNVHHRVHQGLNLLGERHHEQKVNIEQMAHAIKDAADLLAHWRRRFPLLDWRLKTHAKPGAPLDLFTLKRAQDAVKRESVGLSFKG